MTFSCNFGGEPEPSISWIMNGSPLDTGGNSRISFMADNKHLTIENVNRADSGEYRCVAHNSIGNVSSNASTLSVQCKKTPCPFGFISYKRCLKNKSNRYYQSSSQDGRMTTTK